MAFSAFIPLITSLVSAIGGAAAKGKGQSGQQGKTDATSTQESLEELIRQLTGTTEQREDREEKPTEDPTFTALRQALIPLLTGELKRGQEPVYGEPQKLGFMAELNKLAKASSSSLMSTLARMGGLSSGRAATGLGNIELGRLGQLSQFFSQLPFMESQARSERMNPLLGLATGWAGPAPLGRTTTGTASGTTTENMTQTGRTTGKGTGTQTTFGPSGWSGFLSNAGGISAFLGGMGARDWWKKRWPTPSESGHGT